jgi:hypothetical protein
LAKFSGKQQESTETTLTASKFLTDSVSAVGTIAYMSPEQARGEDLDARTDLFSFGVVLYEMATGQQAFAGSTAAILFDAILNKAPTSPVRLNSKLPNLKEEDVREIGAKLNVENILEGSVRKAGNRIRIAVQLVSAADGSHYWSERYDREMTDVFWRELEERALREYVPPFCFVLMYAVLGKLGAMLRSFVQAAETHDGRLCLMTIVPTEFFRAPGDSRTKTRLKKAVFQMMANLLIARHRTLESTHDSRGLSDNCRKQAFPLTFRPPGPGV